MRCFLALTTASMMMFVAGCGSAPAPAPSTETKTETPAAAPAVTPAPAESAPAATATTTPAAAATAAPAAPVALTTDDQKTVYAVGLMMANQLASLQLNEAELEIVKRALSDEAAGKAAVDINIYGPKIQTFAQGRQASVAAKAKTEGVAYAAKAATQPGAVKTASGLIYRELKTGTGASPKATDRVKVHYRGTLISGKEFDSSYKRNTPIDFGLNQVIPCWTEGVQKMKVGGKSSLVCPADIAYGEGGKGDIPGGATLLFDVELLGINP